MLATRSCGDPLGKSLALTVTEYALGSVSKSQTELGATVTIPDPDPTANLLTSPAGVTRT